jgi:hypothetical protein
VTETQAVRWSATETSISVEYSPLLMEEIRLYAVEGSQRILRGGLEVGGVLFGIHENRRVTVQAFRKAPIDYALGPAFVLSAKDKATLSEVVRSHEADPELKGMVPVGWFVSHSRAETVSVTAHDEAIFREFFPERWQVTLVVRPARGGIARAGFFIHEPDGSLRREKSYREFDLLPMYHASAGPAPSAPSPIPVANARGSEELRGGVKPRTWLWTALSFLLGAGAAASFFLFLWKPAVPPLGLTVSEEGKQLLIGWNPASISNADSATIEVKEPGSSRLLQIKGQQLARGAYPLEYTSGDLNFRMTTYARDGSILSQESTHYLGHPAGTSRELSDAREEAERLRSENAKLQASLKNQTERARQFEERLKVLDTIMKAERAIKSSSTQPTRP